MTYGFIGLGLIGGSLAKSLKKHHKGCTICAYSRTPSTVIGAQREGIVDIICGSAKDPAFSSCDYIFLCAPVSTNVSALEQLAMVVRDDCILTDVGSVKTPIHQAVESLGLGSRFIGGHPMAGSEKTGYANATDHLFENAYYILTPSPGVPREWVERYHTLVSSLGAIPMILSCKEHDYDTAAISHLPHVIAAALVNTVHDLDSADGQMKAIAAGGFKDITRIASSSPEMWEQICVENQANIIPVLDEFIRQMHEARAYMASENGPGINAMFKKSREYRDSFSSSSLGPIKKTYRIYCDIVDESGAIATIATTLAVNGINIKNIGIINNREFEEAVLSIQFYDETASLQAADVLRQHHYKVWIS